MDDPATSTFDVIQIAALKAKAACSEELRNNIFSMMDDAVCRLHPGNFTLPDTNIAPENKPSQIGLPKRKLHLPTINFQRQTCC